MKTNFDRSGCPPKDIEESPFARLFGHIYPQNSSKNSTSLRFGTTYVASYLDYFSEERIALVKPIWFLV